MTRMRQRPIFSAATGPRWNECYVPVGVNQSCYTKQLYDKDPLTARAFGEIDNYPTYNGYSSAYTAWY